MKKIFILYFSIYLLSIPAISELYALTPQGPSVAINFDNPLPQGSYTSFLNGVFQGIDFGQDKWKWESAYGANSTNHIYFDSPQGESRTFTFSSAPKILESINVFSRVNGTLTISDNNGQIKIQDISPCYMYPIVTGWTKNSTTVKIRFNTKGRLGIDDIVYDK